MHTLGNHVLSGVFPKTSLKTGRDRSAIACRTAQGDACRSHTPPCCVREAGQQGRQQPRERSKVRCFCIESSQTHTHHRSSPGPAHLYSWAVAYAGNATRELMRCSRHCIYSTHLDPSQPSFPTPALLNKTPVTLGQAHSSEHTLLSTRSDLGTR